MIKLKGDSFDTLNTVTRGIIRDSVPIIVPGVATGTLVTVPYNILVTGSLAAVDGLSAAGWGLQSDFGDGSFDINRSATFRSATLAAFAGKSPGYAGDPFGLYSATVRVQAGFAAPLDVELSASAQTAFLNSSNESTSASFDLSQSLYWARISDVAVAGSSVASFTTIGESGTDYAHSFAPVPIPVTWVLFGSGLAGLVKRRRNPQT